jgi:hypothetical protein
MIKRILSLALGFVLAFFPNIVITQNNPAQLLAATGPEPVYISADTLEYQGHRYQRFDIDLTWTEAKAYCENIGGYLAIVTDDDEQFVVQNLIEQGTKNAYWLGGYREGRAGWQWLTADNWAYTNWAEGEPNTGQDDDNYLQILRASHPTVTAEFYFGKWNNANNENYYGSRIKDLPGFVAEFGVSQDPEDPAVPGAVPQDPEEPAVPDAAGDTPVVTDVIGNEDTSDTAVAISEEGWATTDTVVLASGETGHLVDALAVSPLAFQKNAPILLVSGDTVAANVLAEIKRLGAKQIIAVGYVTDPELAHLKSSIPGIAINLLRGANRIETAEMIAAEFKKSESPQGMFIVGYNGVPDAASASSFAAANRYIIKIADSKGDFRGDTSLGGYILGGPTLVKDIAGYPRLFGADRYATNLVVRDTLSYDFARIYVADGGDNLVNALTGSVLAAKFRAPLALMRHSDVSTVDFGGKFTTATEVYVIGVSG